jgi:hypothetical protein
MAFCFDQMPKEIKDAKGKRQKAGVATAQTDDDFDDMLAEVCDADVASLLAAGSSTTTNPPSSSSSSGNNNPSPTPAARARTRRAEARALVLEMAIVQACATGDMGLLRQWAKRGIRFSSAEPLFQAAGRGKLDVVRLLLRELGADVGLLHDGFPALCMAAQEGHEHVVRCLVQEFSANVNQATTKGNMPLILAAQEGHEHVVRTLV